MSVIIFYFKAEKLHSPKCTRKTVASVVEPACKSTANYFPWQSPRWQYGWDYLKEDFAVGHRFPGWWALVAVVFDWLLLADDLGAPVAQAASPAQGRMPGPPGLRRRCWPQLQDWNCTEPRNPSDCAVPCRRCARKSPPRRSAWCFWWSCSCRLGWFSAQSLELGTENVITFDKNKCCKSNHL